MPLNGSSKEYWTPCNCRMVFFMCLLLSLSFFPSQYLWHKTWHVEYFVRDYAKPGHPLHKVKMKAKINKYVKNIKVSLKLIIVNKKYGWDEMLQMQAMKLLGWWTVCLDISYQLLVSILIDWLFILLKLQFE